MAANGYNAYDLTGQLEFWTDKDLCDYIADSDVMMGLEKYQVIRLAQELADRFPLSDGDEYEEDEFGSEDPYGDNGRFHGREDNE